MTKKILRFLSLDWLYDWLFGADERLRVLIFNDLAKMNNDWWEKESSRRKTWEEDTLSTHTKHIEALKEMIVISHKQIHEIQEDKKRAVLVDERDIKKMNALCAIETHLREMANK